MSVIQPVLDAIYKFYNEVYVRVFKLKTKYG